MPVVTHNGLPTLQENDIYNPQNPSQYMYTSWSVLESDGKAITWVRFTPRQEEPNNCETSMALVITPM